eukprot:scaffold112238_cov28-Tisochrysis_lutea.AAC.5
MPQPRLPPELRAPRPPAGHQATWEPKGGRRRAPWAREEEKRGRGGGNGMSPLRCQRVFLPRLGRRRQGGRQSREESA